MGSCEATAERLTLVSVDGAWSDWREGAEPECGGTGCTECQAVGQQPVKVEIRRCDKPYPMNEGAPCVGNTVRAEKCAQAACSVGPSGRAEYEIGVCEERQSGSVTNSARSTDCTFRCESNGKFLGRFHLPNGFPCRDDGLCVNGQCLHSLCPSNAYLVKSVDECPEPVNCSYTEWSPWSGCTKSCGLGQKRRTRAVSRQAKYNGAQCNDGAMVETRYCKVVECPVKCVLSSWSAYGPCSATCGEGTEERTRDIIQQPRFGGKKCPTQLTEAKSCKEKDCSVDCSYSQWSVWSICTELCDGGKQERTKTITQKTVGSGVPCNEQSTALKQERTCNEFQCSSMDCVYNEWGAWTSCSNTCGTGTRTRTRTIKKESNPGGRMCLESLLTDEQQCTTPCPTPTSLCEYSPWTPWSDCSRMCGQGTRQRNKWLTAGSESCGKEKQTEACTGHCPCAYAQWSEWSACSATCGKAMRRRTRALEEGDKETCSKPLTSLQYCEYDPCPVDCEYGEWSEWGACGVSCGAGLRTARREVTVVGENGGEACNTDDLSKTSSCVHKNPCPDEDQEFVETVAHIIGHQEISDDWLSVGPTHDCKRLCMDNRDFECQAYTWYPGGPCYLHGKITRHIVTVSTSQFSLFERKHKNESLSSHTICKQEKTSNSTEIVNDTIIKTTFTLSARFCEATCGYMGCKGIFHKLCNANASDIDNSLCS